MSARGEHLARLAQMTARPSWSGWSSDGVDADAIVSASLDVIA